MRLLFVFLLFLLPATAQAQSAPPRQARILFLAAPAGAPERLHLWDGQMAREVELPRMNFSEPVTLPPGDLTLRLLSEPPVEGSPPAAEAPSAALPEAVTDVYLLVVSDPANPVAPVRLQIIDAGRAAPPPGGLLWINLTEHAVGGVVGRHRLAMEPRSRHAMDSPVSGEGEYPVNLAYRVPGVERPFPVCETSWLHDPRSRTIVFIFQEPGRRAPRVLGFADFRASEQASDR